MRRCHRCDRHVFEASTRCPFCGAAHRMVASPAPVLGVLLGLALASCSDRPTNDEGGGSGGGTAGTSAGPTTGDSATGPLTGMVDGTTTTTGPATTAMTVTATDDGTTGGTTDGTTGTTTDGSTTFEDPTVTVPPYAGAFPDDEDAASTTGEPAP